MRRIHTIIISFMLAILASFALSGSAVALAAPGFGNELPPTASTSKDTACSSLTLINANQDCSSNGDKVKNLIRKIVVILSIIAGIVAVVMIVVSGLRFVTSAGDSSKVAGAKNALVYAIIGLVIVALSQLLIHFVLSTANAAVTPCATNPDIVASDPACKP